MTLDIYLHHDEFAKLQPFARSSHNILIFRLSFSNFFKIINMEEHNINCWEFKKCGREPGGKNAERYGVCSASIEIDCDGLNDGKNGGRSCWLWREFACGKIMKRSSVQNIKECHQCTFYNLVKKNRIKQLWKRLF